MDDSLKQIGKDLWQNKPLLIALALAFGVLAFILIRNSQNQLSASSAPQGTMPAGATAPTTGGGTYVEESYSNYAPTTITNPVQAVASAASTVYKTIKSGSLETTPRDTAGGHNILTVPSGANVTVLSGPVPDPQGTSKRYYVASYNNQTGYIGSDVLGI